MKLYQMPLHKLHDMRMKKQISTCEITRSVILRIEETESKINAYISQYKKEALGYAKKADEKLAKSGNTVSPLEGMPLAVKDIFNVKGTRTTCGSKILESYVSPYESSATEKLRDLGYGCIGKTNMDEFAMGSSNENSAFGVTRNPWNLEYVPGGSSGGSAAAVAAGEALAALGTDTGGSVRLPASFTGITGIKPTYGRISRYGMVAFASSLDQCGPLTKDVEDAALLLESLSGYDPKDATSLDVEVPRFRNSLNQDVKGMKVGILKELDLSLCDADVVGVYEENLNTLKLGGVEIQEVSLKNLQHAIATYYVLAPSEASSNLGRFDGVRYGHRAEAETLKELYEKTRDEGFGDEVKLRILIGTFALSAGYYDAYYLKAQKVQNLIRHQFQEAFQSVDAIATPVSAAPAFKIGDRNEDPLQMYLTDLFTVPANLAGIPAISVPGGFSRDNFPIGFQLQAAHLQEEKLFKLAHWFEQNQNFTSPKLSV